MEKYKFNKDKLEFVKVRRGIKWWIRKVVQYTVVSMFLALLYYVVFSLFFSTEEERRLARENKIMEQEYMLLQEKMEVLDNTVSNLKLKDREIYRSIFDADPIIVSLIGQESSILERLDTTKSDDIVMQSMLMLDAMAESVGSVNGSIEAINVECADLGVSVKHIPSVIPIRNFSIGQTGASVGNKINPFYKTIRRHTGIDLLGTMGTDVIATANGVVEFTQRSKTGSGNVVIIDHKNGYKTTYSHLGDILVRRGQNIDQGSVIGRIGLSGMTFAPHLHYEVAFNGKVVDPVNYFFAELSPEQFRDMVALSSNTGQSLD